MDTTLLADPAAVRLEKIISGAGSLLFVVSAIRRKAVCPLCGTISAVRLELCVRRFRCTNDLCQRSIFCEPLSSVVARYARKTARLADALTLIGFALGGRPDLPPSK